MVLVGGRWMRMIWIYDTLPADMIGRYGIRYETIYSPDVACVG